MQKLSKRLYARVTEKEWEKIRKRMSETGYTNISAFIRKMLLNGYLIHVDMSDVREVLRLLRIESNNINQYAKKANQTGSIYAEDVRDIKEKHEEILSRMGEIVERLSGI